MTETTMNENELMTFNRVPTSKKEQKALADGLARRVTDGEVPPLAAYVQMKSMAESIGLFLKDDAVREAVMAECLRYGRGETPMYGGAEVGIMDSGVRYDYSACRDPVWHELHLQAEQANARLKAREEYLRAIREPKTEVDESTGEVYTLYPPARQATTTLTVKFKR